MRRIARLAVISTLLALLFLQSQGLTRVICLQANGTRQIEPCTITGQCTCHHPPASAPGLGRLPATNACRDFSLSSPFQVGSQPQGQETTLLLFELPSSSPWHAFRQDALSFPVRVPIPPGPLLLVLSLRC